MLKELIITANLKFRQEWDKTKSFFSCNYRMVKNISRGEEGRVLPEDLHRILGETYWEPIRAEERWRSHDECTLFCFCRFSCQFNTRISLRTHRLAYSINSISRMWTSDRADADWSAASGTSFSPQTTVTVSPQKAVKPQNGPQWKAHTSHVFICLFQQWCSR